MTIVKNIFVVIIGLEIIIALAMLIGLLGIQSADIGLEAVWKLIDLEELYGPDVWQRLEGW